MLYLDEPLRIGRLDVFRDYNKPSLFYYLPASPGVAVEGGEPLFHLMVIRGEDDAGEETGAGFLTMTADLKVPPNALEDARRELTRRFGVSAELAPLQVESGSVKVSMLGTSTGDEAAGAFVENVMAHSTPSLYGDQRAVFSAELSQDGAAALVQALQNEGASPVMLVYELTYRGLLPAYECKIVIEFDQSYDYLRNRMTFASLMFQADIDAEMEELQKRGAIKIEEVVYHTEEPEARTQRLNELKTLARELAQWTFFKPGINPGQVLAQNVRDLHAERDTSGLLTTGRASPFYRMMTGTGGGDDAQPARPAVAAEGTSGRRVSGNAVPAAADQPAQPDQPAEPAQPADDDSRSAVDAWNEAGRPNATYQLREIRQRERQRIEFELSQVSAMTRTIAPQGQIRLLPGMADGGRIQFVDTNHEFFKRIEGAVANEADLAALGVKSMNVRLMYGGEEEQFELDATEEHRYGFFLDDQGSRELRYQVTVNYKPDAAIGDTSSSHTTEVLSTNDRHIEIDPRVAGAFAVLDVQAAAVDWDLVSQVQAKVIYDDSRGELDGRTTVILTRDATGKTVLVRPRDPRDEIRVEAVFIYADGAQDTVHLAREGSGPLIINQPPDSTHTVELTLFDPMNRYQNVRVRLDRSDDGSDPAARAIDLSGHLARASWSFRPENDERSYRYQTTYFLDGPIREEDWVRSTERALDLGDKVDGILRVEVQLLGLLADGDMRALRIRLRYPDAPDWADPDFETTLSGSVDGSEPIRWEVPMADRRETSYEVELQWFPSGGGRVEVGPIQTSQETILIDPTLPEEIL